MDDNPPINIIYKEKSCDSSLLSYLPVPPSPEKILPEIGHHFVTPGNIRIGKG